MVTSTQHRVYELLREMQQAHGLEPIKRLFWTELNYDRANSPLSLRGWPEGASTPLESAPLVLATAGGQPGGFNVIYCQLKGNLLITPQRPVIERLLSEYPYSLFIFSDRDQTHWHFVNVKYDADVARRRLFRRIRIGPEERLRTAAERIAMLNLENLSRDLFGVSPLAVQARHDEAFDVEAVTRTFFRDYRTIFEAAEKAVEGIDGDEPKRLFVQKLFNRMMFIAFLERKRWLTFNGESGEYLRALWQDYRHRQHELREDNFYSDRLKLLFFSGLNDINRTAGKAYGPLIDRIGTMPYLNGGLFEEDELDRDAGITVPDEVIGRAIDGLFYHYNFTVTESTPLDVEVAVDPEMLGKIFEELVTGRHESGSYYTPKSVVSFMGRESLKGYLRTACPDEPPDAVEQFVERQAAENLRDPEAVLEALRRVTICDPACGSGAYLLGLLQELLRLRDALFRGERRLDDLTAYERKLAIIQNNLYGVDIDPLAVNITRLRLWLSLIVDFEGDNPPPLPNLDFKIEVGDSIRGPDPSGGLQPDLFRHQQIEEYQRLKAEYLSAHGGAKAGLYQQVQAQRQAIAEWVQSGGKANGFDWAVDFAEVFARSEDGRPGGFDVVITNPPYVRQELIRDMKPALRQIYGDLYGGTADLYVYFYYRALQMLRPGGVLCFISSNKWMRAGYGEKLRTHLADTTTVQTIVDFGDLPIFTATAYPCVVVIQKGAAPEGHELRTLTITDYEMVERVADEVRERAWPQPQASLRPDGWALVQPDVLALTEKLRQSGQPLGEFVQGETFRGVTTGLNGAFVIDEETRSQLIAEDPRSTELIKPWLRGRDIKRWSVDWAGLHVIFTRRGIRIENYPAIHNYLARFRDRLEPGVAGGRKPGPYEWYEIQDNTAYYAEFERPKIVWPDIASRPEFCFDPSGAYGGNTMYIMPTDDLYLLGLLNSHLMEFFYRQISSTIRGDYLRFIATYIEQLPIPAPTPDQHTAIEAIVRSLLDLRGQGPEVAGLEAELNALVYQVYGLSEEEIALIEASVGQPSASGQMG